MKALIIAPAWVGDMVMTHTLVQRLSTLYKGIELHIAAPGTTAPLAARMTEVSKVHALDFDHGELGLARRRKLGRSLRSQGYAVAYVLPNSWKSALVPFFAGIGRRVGWQGEARYVLLNDRRKLDRERFPLMIERCMALAEPNGVLPDKPYPQPVLQTDSDNLTGCLSSLDLSPERVTVMCPGAEFGAAKKWPAEHYAEVAKAVTSAGGQVWLMGSPKDVEDCVAISTVVPGVQNLAGRTTLLDAIDLMSVADQVICNDSGLMHIACALNKPTVAIFGSTSPAFTPPLCDAAVVIEQTLACRPCFQRTCPLGHMDCLRQLMPRQVIGQLGL